MIDDMLDIKDVIVPVMYVLVRKDLPYVHRAVQCGHAVAKYLIDHTSRVCNADGLVWSNGTMVYVGVKDEEELCIWKDIFTAMNRPVSVFIEPDWAGGPQKTALSILGTRGEFPMLKTLRMPTGYFIQLKEFVNYLYYKIKIKLCKEI